MKLTLQEWLFVIAGPAVGTLSIASIVEWGSVHFLAPLVGLVISVLTCVGLLAGSGVQKVVYGLFGISGVAINVVAGVVVIGVLRA